MSVYRSVVGEGGRFGGEDDASQPPPVYREIDNFFSSFNRPVAATVVIRKFLPRTRLLLRVRWMGAAGQCAGSRRRRVRAAEWRAAGLLKGGGVRGRGGDILPLLRNPFIGRQG